MYKRDGFDQSFQALCRKHDGMMTALSECLAALYGARELMGDIGNIHHAIELAKNFVGDDSTTSGESDDDTPLSAVEGAHQIDERGAEASPERSRRALAVHFIGPVGLPDRPYFGVFFRLLSRSLDSRSHGSKRCEFDSHPRCTDMAV